ncbi:MAG: prepilin-type N-terminal cleavage/methylation domain-containing protein [Candidatus Omnitrophota bacterium]
MRGFTILESLISILIFSIITIALGLGVVAGKNSLFTSDVPTQLRQNVLFGIVSMSREIRQTAPAKTNISSDSSSSSITFQIPNDNNSDGSIVDTLGNIEWGTNITYARNGANQIIRTQNGVSSVIAANITALQFSRPAGEDNLIQIDITAQRTNNTGNWQDAEQAIVKMRN